MAGVCCNLSLQNTEKLKLRCHGAQEKGKNLDNDIVSKAKLALPRSAGKSQESH
jgi:hypothetical protein